MSHLSNAEDESFFFEYKSDKTTNEKFIKEVSAFANTYGGYIFLGVNDDKSIGGCKEWTEQKIHSVIHACITPMPNFDVKKFELSAESVVLVVKIETGEFPPYITNGGKIYERVSSGSFAIKDSNKLQQIYYRNEKHLKLIEEKLSMEEIDKNKAPNNLCGYLDMGFHSSFSERTRLQDNFYSFNLNKVINYLKNSKNAYSFSRVGRSYVISFGAVTCTDNNGKKVLPSCALNNFIEIMDDGSVKCRILLFSRPQEKEGMVNIDDILCVNSLYLNIYKLLFEKELKNKFISAQKYEKLTVLKQFEPNYLGKTLQDYVEKHIDKYGNNLVVSGNRVPRTGFITIDKKLFEENNVKYTCKNLIDQLFFSRYFMLGFIDKM